ncbi:MAG TPA: hypothetical protein VFD58_36760 [Blastocatellia bacterium]|nr:hypothetical protein [Blastocatellia bacterium]
MLEKEFTQAEAGEKVGRRVRLLVSRSSLPPGTVGQVVFADRLDGGYDVAIEWEIRAAGTPLRPLREWLTRGEYEEYLVEE